MSQKASFSKPWLLSFAACMVTLVVDHIVDEKTYVKPREGFYIVCFDPEQSGKEYQCGHGYEFKELVDEIYDATDDKHSSNKTSR